MWSQWVVGTTLGAVLGRSLGNPAAFGFDFAFTAVFICILVGFCRNWRTGAVLAASGGAAALAKLIIPGVWYIAHWRAGRGRRRLSPGRRDRRAKRQGRVVSAGHATVLAIAGMAVATYITRVLGLYLMRFMKVEGRTKAALDAMPPAILMAVIAPVALPPARRKPLPASSPPLRRCVCR